MRFQIRQQLFSLGDRFGIKDETGREVFEVRGEVFAFGKKLRLRDLEGRELVYIEQKLFHLLPAYEIHFSDGLAARIQKRPSLGRPRFAIESPHGNFDVRGDLWGRRFEILRDGTPVAQVDKAFFAVADTYGVEIADGQPVALLLALTIVIDAVLFDRR